MVRLYILVVNEDLKVEFNIIVMCNITLIYISIESQKHCDRGITVGGINALFNFDHGSKNSI